jgi:hypothetical protein
MPQSNTPDVGMDVHQGSIAVAFEVRHGAVGIAVSQRAAHNLYHTAVSQVNAGSESHRLNPVLSQ